MLASSLGHITLVMASITIWINFGLYYLWQEAQVIWRYILVGGIFLSVVCKSKFVARSVLSVMSWLLLCVQIPLNTTTSSCLQIQALKQYQLSDTTWEFPLSAISRNLTGVADAGSILLLKTEHLFQPRVVRLTPNPPLGNASEFWTSPLDAQWRRTMSFWL